MITFFFEESNWEIEVIACWLIFLNVWLFVISFGFVIIMFKKMLSNVIRYIFFLFKFMLYFICWSYIFYWWKKYFERSNNFLFWIRILRVFLSVERWYKGGRRNFMMSNLFCNFFFVILFGKFILIVVLVDCEIFMLLFLFKRRFEKEKIINIV